MDYGSFGSRDDPSEAEVGRPAASPLSSRHPVARLLVVGLALLAVVGATTRGRSGGAPLPASLSAVSPSVASIFPSRQFAAQLPGQDDDKASRVTANSSSPWLVHDVNLRAHEGVREFLRSQGINESADEKILLDYVPRIEVSTSTSFQYFHFEVTSLDQPSNRDVITVQTLRYRPPSAPSRGAAAPGPRRRRVRRAAGCERLRLVLPHEQRWRRRRVDGGDAARRRLPHRHDAQGRGRLRAADHPHADDRHRRRPGRR